MRVALAYPEIAPEALVYGQDMRIEPLGLLYLSASLLRDGHETCVIDQRLERLTNRQLFERLVAFRPDLIGLPLTYANCRPAVALAADLKAKLHVPLIAGGVFPTAHPEILDRTVFDLVVIGEGEETLREVVRSYQDGRTPRDIPGTAWRDDGEIRRAPPRSRVTDLDALPFPDRRFSRPQDLLVRMFFPLPLWRHGVLMLITSRGCGFRCPFCASNIVWQGHWTGRSPENVVAEIRQLQEAHRISHFFFVDEEINFDRARALRLYRLMKAEKLNLSWAAETTVHCLDLELAEAMVEAGLRSLFIGYESGAPEILQHLPKRFDPADGLQVNRYLQRRGVFLTGNFMVGLPWETEDTLRATRAYARRLNLDITAVSYNRPQFGTPLWSLASRLGLFDPSRYDETAYDPYRPALATLSLSPERVEQAARDFMRAIHLRPGYWLRILWRSCRSPRRLWSYGYFFGAALAGGLKMAWHKFRSRGASR